MKIGELLVEIGLKGADVAVKGLTSVGSNLQKTGGFVNSLRLEFLALLYALEQISSAEAQMGKSLVNFSLLTGDSSEQLQSWINAARQSGVSAEDTTAAFTNLKKVLAQMSQGNPPEGLKRLQTVVDFDVNKAKGKNGIFYAMKKIEEFTKKYPGDVEYANEAIRSFIGGDAFIPFLRENNKNMDKLFGQIISPARQKQLRQIGVEFENLKDSFTKGVGADFAAEVVLPALKMIENAMKGILNIIRSFKSGQGGPLLDFLKAFGLALAGMAAYLNPLSAVVTGLVFLLSEFEKYKEGKENVFQNEKTKDIFANKFTRGLFSGDFPGFKELMMGNLVPATAGGAGNVINQTNNTNIYGSNDPKETSRAHGSEVHRSTQSALQSLRGK